MKNIKRKPRSKAEKELEDANVLLQEQFKSKSYYLNCVEVTNIKINKTLWLIDAIKKRIKRMEENHG